MCFKSRELDKVQKAWMNLFGGIFLIAISCRSYHTQKQSIDSLPYQSFRPQGRVSNADKIAEAQNRLRERYLENIQKKKSADELKGLNRQNQNDFIEAVTQTATYMALRVQEKREQSDKNAEPQMEDESSDKAKLGVGIALLGTSVFSTLMAYKIYRYRPFDGNIEGKNWNLKHPYLQSNRFDILKHATALNFLDMYDRFQTGWYGYNQDNKLPEFDLKPTGDPRGVWFYGDWNWSFEVLPNLPDDIVPNADVKVRSSTSTWIGTLRSSAMQAALLASLSKKEKIALAQWIVESRAKVFMTSALLAAEKSNYHLANFYADYALANPFEGLNPKSDFERILEINSNYTSRQTFMSAVEQEVIQRYFAGTSPLSRDTIEIQKSRWQNRMQNTQNKIKALDPDFFQKFGHKSEIRFRTARAIDAIKNYASVGMIGLSVVLAAAGVYMIADSQNKEVFGLVAVESHFKHRPFYEAVADLFTEVAKSVRDSLE